MPVPPLFKTALVWGLFMGVSANVRYQVREIRGEGGVESIYMCNQGIGGRPCAIFGCESKLGASQVENII